jgi:hypothetical protein
MRKLTITMTTILALAATILVNGADSAYADQLYHITITNVTRGQVITPPVVISHNKDFSLFTPGQPASDQLTVLAEDGVTDSLVNLLSTDPNVYDYAVSGAGLMPGESVTLDLWVKDGFRKLSAAGMLASSNDAFFAIDGIHIFPKVKNRMESANAYDAGTEANNESCDYIPGPPCDSHFVRATEGAEGFVSVHSGIFGIGDLEPSQFDWNNPVAEVMITY